MLEKKVIAIGSDHVGFRLKEKIISYFRAAGRSDIEVIDCGCNGERTDFPVIAKEVCEKIQNGEATHGILASGAGYDMCIAANKYGGIRAVNTTDIGVIKLGREQSNINVFCVAALIHASEYQLTEGMKAFLNTDFSFAGRHVRRVSQIEAPLTPVSDPDDGLIASGSVTLGGVPADTIAMFSGGAKTGKSALDQVDSIATGLADDRDKASD